MRVERALQESFLFGDFPPHEIRRLSQICTPRSLRPGEVLFREGEAGDALYLVDKGSIRIFRVLSETYDETLVTLGPGGVFGEMSFIDRVARSSSAVAMTASRLVELSRSDFDGALAEQPRFASRVLGQLARIMAMRIRSTEDRLGEAVRWNGEIRLWAGWNLEKLPGHGTRAEVVVTGLGPVSGKVVDMVRNPIGYAYLVEGADGRIHWIPDDAVSYVRVRRQ
jgi:CRP-like cAMP-binding protein